jgi:phosphoglycolate phosphatase
VTAPGLAYEHVAFDLDGTLIDSRADLAAAVNHVLRAFALPELPPATLYGYVGDGARTLVERALGPTHQERLRSALAAFLAYYGEHLLDATHPYPGIVDMLTALAERGAVLSVLSNKPVVMSHAILDGLGLGARFVDVLGGDSLATRKPDPAGLEWLRSRTATPRHRMLLVGDSAIDLRTARAAEIAFVGVTWGLTPGDLLAAAPHRLIDHPAELVALVEGRSGSGRTRSPVRVDSI